MMEKNSDLEKYARELQKQILEQLKRRYSPTVIELWQNPKNFRKLESPDGYAKVQGLCGDNMEMFLKMKNEKIDDCCFYTDGCGTTIACGSLATQLAKGRSFTEALAKVSADTILQHLGGLPKEDVHCAQLAAETLRRALADQLYQRKQSWKKAYRKEE
jgi:nitrogen fixation NifU-like protein